MKGNRCTIALLSTIMVCLLAVPAMAADHHVYGGDSVQTVINGATAGDTIYVHDYAGTYAKFDVTKRLYMIGVDMPTVDAGGSGSAISVHAASSTIKGFEVTNAGTNMWGDGGIGVFGVDGIRIEENLVDGNNGNGIYLQYTSGHQIINNTITDNGYGGVRYGDSCTITGNTFSGGGYTYSIAFGGSNLIYHNNFYHGNRDGYSGNPSTWYSAALGEGNYWWNYPDNDCDNDGIGDERYEVPDEHGGHYDEYPLINPWDGQVVTSNFNPVVTSCNVSGSEVNSFLPGDTVYVTATGLLPNTDYKIWIQPESVDEGEALSTGTDPSSTQESVTSDANGDLSVTSIWANIPTGAATEYDIVLDCQGCGTGTYNVANDGLDDASIAGFVAPVPELATLTLMGCGLGALFGLVKFKNRRKR